MPLVSYEVLTAGLKKHQFFGMQSRKCIYQPMRRDIAKDLIHHHLRTGKKKSEEKRGIKSPDNEQKLAVIHRCEGNHRTSDAVCAPGK